MLTSVVRTTYNSTQAQQRQPTHLCRSSSHSQNGTEVQRTPPDLTEATSSSSKPLASSPQNLRPPTRRLIANPRSKFPLTDRELSPLQISNRERIATFFSALRLGLLPLLATSHSTLATEFLIVTLELNFPATRTKQTANTISNRYKRGLLRPVFRSIFRCEIWSAAPAVDHLTHSRLRTSIVRLPRLKILDRGGLS